MRLEDLPETVTAEEAADYLRVGVEWVRRQCKAGQIKGATNIRGKAGWRIPRESLRLTGGDTPAARPRPPRGRSRAR